jgi:NAD(P)-dependent dehydrogenase (short-subunit alcohol dehydrogenase family)
MTMHTPITLITGAAKGLGFETARQLAQRGHHVLLGVRDAQRGVAAASELRAYGQVKFILLDVTSVASIQAAEQRIQQEYGRLDVLINNAAILLDHYQAAAETTEEQLLQSLQTNVIGVHTMIRAFAALLRKSDKARVVNVSSGAGQLSDMLGSVWAPAYQISKTALNAVTRIWATEFQSDGIPVNSVCPGWCRTEMGGDAATRSPEEGAAGIVWLADEAARDSTGRFFRDREEIPW